MPKELYDANIIFVNAARVRTFFLEFVAIIYKAFFLTLTLNLGFWMEAVLPSLIAILASIHLLRFSQDLYLYLSAAQIAPNSIELLWDGVVVVALIYSFVYLILVSFCVADDETIPPLLQMLPIFRRGAAADMELLFFNLCWLIPFTTAVLKGMARTPLRELTPGFGIFSASGSLLFACGLALSFWRRHGRGAADPGLTGTRAQDPLTTEIAVKEKAADGLNMTSADNPPIVEPTTSSPTHEEATTPVNEGGSVPDGTKGKSTDRVGTEIGTKAAKAESQETGGGWIWIGVVIAVAVVAVGVLGFVGVLRIPYLNNVPESKPVIQEAIELKPRYFIHPEFEVEPGAQNAKLTGHYTSSGDSARSIHLYVFSPENYKKFNDSEPADHVYDSGGAAEATLDCPLKPGHYVVVVQNTSTADVTVQLELVLLD